MSLQYYRYPFAKNSSQPKIPDGKIESSIGLSRKQIVSFQIDVDAVETPVVYILHIPHFNNMCTVYQKDANFNWVEQETAYTIDSGHMTVNQNDTLYSISKNSPVMWRLVSAGLKLLPTSASVNLDGFYETITVPVKLTKESWAKEAVALPDVGVQHLKWAPAPQVLLDLENTKLTWRNHQSYHTGNLSELHRFAYDLPVNNPDHTPREFLDSYGSTSENYIKDYIDNNFLMRIIRVEGKAEQDFNILLQTNYEFVYGFDSILRAFQTENRNFVNMADINNNKRANENANGTNATENADFGPSVVAMTPERGPTVRAIRPQRNLGFGNLKQAPVEQSDMFTGDISDEQRLAFRLRTDRALRNRKGQLVVYNKSPLRKFKY